MLGCGSCHLYSRLPEGLLFVCAEPRTLSQLDPLQNCSLSPTPGAGPSTENRGGRGKLRGEPVVGIQVRVKQAVFPSQTRPHRRRRCRPIARDRLPIQCLVTTWYPMEVVQPYCANSPERRAYSLPHSQAAPDSSDLIEYDLMGPWYPHPHPGISIPTPTPGHAHLISVLS